MRKPNKKVESPKIARKDGYNFDASWKVPSAAVAEKVKKGKKMVANLRRFTSLYVTWRVDLESGKDPYDRDVIKKERETKASESMDKFEATKPKKTFHRNDFYPVKSPKVKAFVVSIAGHNSAGTGDAKSATYAFKLPRVPTVEWSYDQNSASVTVTVKTNPGTDESERYDTMIRTAVKIGDGTETAIREWSATQETTWSATYQVASYDADLSIGETLEFRAWAYARGFKGDNPAKAKAVYAARLVAAPGTPSIESVTVDTLAQNGMIRVGVKPGANTGSLQLERRHGDDGNWENVTGGTEDGTATAIYDSIGQAEPVPGEKIYYRVVASRDNYYRTSEPFYAEALYSEAATAAESHVGMVSTVPGDDGASIYAIFGWDTETPEGLTGGIEVSWAQDATAWESTQAPSTFDITWEDATPRSQNWPHTAGVYIRGLEQGTAYYVRGRRFIDSEIGRTFSGYTDFGNGETDEETRVMPVTRPASVSLSGPSFVARGQSIPLTWTFEGDSTQTEYHVFIDGQDGAPVAEGFDAVGAVSVPADKYGNADAVTLYVLVGAGGALTRSSQDLTVGISDYPTCRVEVPATLTAQPAEFDVYCDSPSARLICSCESQGIGGRGALDTGEQFNGDTVWTQAVTPGWVLSDEEYHATVSMGMGVDFADGGSYTVTVKAVDLKTGLQSDEVSASFDVLWAHQAPVPPDTISVSINRSGRYAQIQLYAPDDYAEGDSYYVYRGSANGYELVAGPLGLTDSLIDRYAAFGDQTYRVETRTVDGDTAWNDYGYTLNVDATRFDWPGGFIELDKSLNFEDSWEKDFSERVHMDGSIGGGFNPAIRRTGTYTAKVIKDLEPETMSALLSMAEYAGTVYCRRNDGHAFECNVMVSTTNRKWSMLLDPSLSITRVNLTEKYMVAAADVSGGIVDEREEEEQG